jgi:hypothetical protein
VCTWFLSPFPLPGRSDGVGAVGVAATVVGGVAAGAGVVTVVVVVGGGGAGVGVVGVGGVVAVGGGVGFGFGVGVGVGFGFGVGFGVGFGLTVRFGFGAGDGVAAGACAPDAGCGCDSRVGGVVTGRTVVTRCTGTETSCAAGCDGRGACVGAGATRCTCRTTGFAVAAGRAWRTTARTCRGTGAAASGSTSACGRGSTTRGAGVAVIVVMRALRRATLFASAATSGATNRTTSAHRSVAWSLPDTAPLLRPARTALRPRKKFPLPASHHSRPAETAQKRVVGDTAERTGGGLGPE